MSGALSLAHRKDRHRYLLAGGPALVQAHSIPTAPENHRPAPESSMSSPADTLIRDTGSDAGYGSLDRFLRKQLLARLANLRGGELRVVDALGDVRIGRANAPDA